MAHESGTSSPILSLSNTGSSLAIRGRKVQCSLCLLVDIGSNCSTGDFVSTVDHDHGASIAVAGRYNVHTVAKGNKLALTVYNQKTGHWEPTKVLIDQIPSASLAAITHPKHYSNTFTSTVYTQQRPSEITKVQFNSDNTWKESLLPVTL